MAVPHAQEILATQLDAAKYKLYSGSVIKPKYRVFSPQGDFIVVIEATDALGHSSALPYVKSLMAWRLAQAFTLTLEMTHPRCLASLHIARQDCTGRMVRFARNPIRFGPACVLGANDIPLTFHHLLPKPVTHFTPTEMRFLAAVLPNDQELLIRFEPARSGPGRIDVTPVA